MRRAFLGLALALGACGPLTTDAPMAAARDAYLQSRQAAATPPPEITRATFEASEVPLILVAPVATEEVFLMALVGRNGATETYRDAAGRSLSLRDGVLVASRGFGDDLMGADTPGLSSALVRGTGQYGRAHSWLGTLDEIRTERFACEMLTLEATTIALFGQQIATRQMGEVCVQGEAGFANNYWVTARGDVVQSRQWLSPAIGYVDIQAP